MFFNVGQYELSIHLLSNALKNSRQFALVVLPIDFNNFFPSWHLTDVFNPRLEKCKSDSYNKRHENFSHQCNAPEWFTILIWWWHDKTLLVLICSGDMQLKCHLTLMGNFSSVWKFPVGFDFKILWSRSQITLKLLINEIQLFEPVTTIYISDKHGTGIYKFVGRAIILTNALIEACNWLHLDI